VAGDVDDSMATGDSGSYYWNCGVKKDKKERGIIERGRICHYAINPNVSPYSHSRLVLLFETEGGWNQFGGPEILTFENHKGKGCNILFNDGHVDFVKPKQLGELKWE